MSTLYSIRVEPLPGTAVGSYRLLSPLARGGMAEVWRARDDAGHEVAVKLVRGTTTAGARERFRREMHALESVRHPAVVRVLELVDTPGGVAMVMELLDGESLEQRLARGELPLAETAGVILAVGAAVGAAHAVGIVHRDLKPPNVFLERSAGVKVLDFGIAKFRGPLGETLGFATLTAPGTVMGTPCYMAPEQVFGERDVDQRADVFAVGLMVFECLTGILPTRAKTLAEVAKIFVRGGVWSLRSAAPDLPDDLIAAVDGMLALDRGRRAPDFGALTAALERHARS